MTWRQKAARARRSVRVAFDRVTLERVRAFAITAVTLGAAVAALRADRPAARWTGGAVAVVVTPLMLVVGGRHLYRRRKHRRSQYDALRRVLSSIVQDDSHPFEEDLAIVYTVGNTSKDDRVFRRMKTRAQPGGSLHWRKITERVVGHEDGHLTPRRLRFEVGAPESTEAKVVGLNHDKDTLRVLVAFFPPIKRTFVTWTVSYDVPGGWDPLRRDGEDRQGLTLPNAYWRTLEVAFEFPPGTTGIGFTRCPPDGRPSAVTDQQRPVLRWKATKPPPGRYEFRFRARLPGHPDG
jgi:hypothetical protein